MKEFVMRIQLICMLLKTSEFTKNYKFFNIFGILEKSSSSILTLITIFLIKTMLNLSIENALFFF